MAAPIPSSPKPLNPNPDDPQTLSNLLLPQDPPPPSPATISAAPDNPNPNPNPNPPVITPPPPAVPSFVPSYRPLVPPAMPQYSPVPSHGMQPPGVPSPVSMLQMRPGVMYPPPPGQPSMPYSYMGSAPPPGIHRYPTHYPTMIRPGFPPRPPTPMVATLTRPPITGIRGGPPIVTPVPRPVVPIVPPTEKPQTTVYVGKIAPTVDNDFLLSLLRFCGPVKSWKRAQDPTDGFHKGFGFCEFEAAEGVLRGLRLLTKLRIDGQELLLNINKATREYLERYVEKKTEREKSKDTEAEKVMEAEGAPSVEKQEPNKAAEETKKGSEDSGDKENQYDIQKFGIVTNEDREADREAMEKIVSMIEERLKIKPLPPPPPVRPPSEKSISEAPSKSKDGESDVDIMKDDAPDDKNDDETTSQIKSATEQDKLEATSPDKGSRHDRRSRERDRERDLGREKERELERYERERERERVRRERDRELKMREADRLYTQRVKEWEAREREREHHRRHEKDRQKERERERRRLVINQEDESDDEDTRRRRRKSSGYEEKKRKRQKEKEEDLADRLKEEEEIAEAKRRAMEEEQIEESKPLVSQMQNGSDKANMQEDELMSDSNVKLEQEVCGSDTGDKILTNGSSDEQAVVSIAGSDTKLNSSVPIRKLGFGLIGSGKRTAVPSVFHEEDDEGVDDKKLRPLVPIDYSTDEVQAVQTSVTGQQPNLVAAAEFAKRLSGVNPKDENSDVERERSRWSSDRSSHRERTRYEEGTKHARDESREKSHKVFDGDGSQEEKSKNENKKLFDAKQLIDVIPKTKDELFSYAINWDVYDKHKLHERMRPWISKKITEFLGEEEETLVDYIVTSTKEHKQASGMLEMLQAILDDEAEMFVLKMWRMLIFEIKKVESGLPSKTRS